MSKSIIYLAGGMEKAGEGGRIWRREITPHLKELGYRVWNPYTEEENVGVTTKEIAYYKHHNYDKFLESMHKIVKYDIDHLLGCAAVAVKIDASVLAGAGTYGELTMCAYRGIPVYAWIDLINGELDVPGWAMGCLTKYTTDKESFYDMIPPAHNPASLGSGSEVYLNEWELCDK